MKYFAVLIVLLLPINVLATELTALELEQYCKQVTLGSVGDDFDKELAQQCKGYMAGFFDSMIIIEKVTGKKVFCIPRSLPKTQNNLILSAWINKNKSIASQTTAAVALYAAFSKAFGC